MNIDKLAFSMAIEDRRYELVRRKKESRSFIDSSYHYTLTVLAFLLNQEFSS